MISNKGEAMKRLISAILTVLMLFGIMLGGVGCGITEHIEDTNGPDNYSLATITDENIINLDMGAMGLGRSTGILNDGVTFKSKRFSGVERIMLTNYILPSDLDIQLAGFYVNSGNLRLVVVNNDEIIADIEPGLFPECRIIGLTGTVSLIIAGESADFEFTVDRLFCERYGITIG